MHRDERLRQILNRIRTRKENLTAEQIAQLVRENPDLPELEQLLKDLTVYSPAPAIPNPSSLTPPLPAPDDPTSGLSPGAWVGPYKLLRKLGQGGMGSVWKAQQLEPLRRTVALKVIRAGLDSQAIFDRFKGELQLLGQLNHPYIPKVFDAGTTEAGPYFVMELVAGLPITAYCDQEQLTVNDRLELFLLACQAVQHAHLNGIIHRDLKPSNLLIAQHEGRPIPKVIDFGLAKALQENPADRPPLTEYGQVLGTLEYMAPEQARPNDLSIDHQADVYSLGVILYELLAGSLPFTRQQFQQEGMKKLHEVGAQPPSARLSSSKGLAALAARRGVRPEALKEQVRGELDGIVMKCLRKQRKQRYATVADLCGDVRRYLDQGPTVRATPRPWMLVAGAIGGLALLIACIVVVAALRPSGAPPDSSARAPEAPKPPEPAPPNKDDAGPKGVKQPVEQAPPRPAPAPPPVRPAVGRADPAGVKESGNWVRDLGDCPGCHWGDVRGVAFSADGTLLATVANTGHQQNSLHLWDAKTLRELDQVSDDVGFSESLAFSDDGKSLATTSGGVRVLLWDVTGQRIQRKSTLDLFGKGMFEYIQHVAFAPGSKAVLALTRGGGVHRWDLGGREVKGGRLMSEVKGRDPNPKFALSADGKTLARAARREDVDKTTVAVCEVGAAKEPEPTLIDESVTGLALSADGKRLALSTSKGLQLWDPSRSPPRVVAPPEWKRTGHNVLRFSGDATRLAAAYVYGADRSVWVYDLTAEKPTPPTELKGHIEAVRGVAFGPDSKTLATCGADHSVRIWEREGDRWRPRVPLDRFAGPVRSVAFAPDGRSVAALSRQPALLPDSSSRSGPPFSSVALWDVEKQASRVLLPPSEGWYTQVAFGPGGGTVLASGGGWPRFVPKVPGQVRAWEAATGKAAGEVTYKGTVHSLSLDAKGRTFAVLLGEFGWERALRLGRTNPPADDGPFDTSDKPDTPFKPEAIALSSDGKVLAVVRNEGKIGDTVATVRFFDATAPDQMKEVRAPLKYGKKYSPREMAFTPDGKKLVSVVQGSQLQVWDLTSPAILTNADVRSRGPIQALAVSPDGRTVATAEGNHSVALWDVSGTKEKGKVAELRRWKFPGHVHALAFDAPGKRLITGNANGTLTLLTVPE